MPELKFIDHYFAKTLLNGKENSILAKLLATSREGSLCMPLDLLPKELLAYTQGDKSPLVYTHNSLYLRRNYELENTILEELKRLDYLVKPIESQKDPSLYPAQEKALRLALSSSLTFITGGPGSGKSTIAKKICETFHKAHKKAHIIFAAPTGKAASNISLPYVENKTLHALLSLREDRMHQKEAPPITADLLLVDESSMISTEIFLSLLKAISSKTRIIFLGDPHQLPPVESGNVFQAIAERSNHVTLDKIIRTDDKSLLSIAQHVKNNDSKAALHELQKNELLAPLPKPLPLDLFETHTLLTPFTKGPYGTELLNIRASSLQKKEHPIIITKNDYKLGLMNGTLGALSDDGDGHAFFTKEGKEKRYPISLLSEYALAYAISIHKSQGSEFPHVAIFLPEGSEEFPSSLLYTAITRAKKSCKIYGSEETVKKVIENRPTFHHNLKPQETP